MSNLYKQLLDAIPAKRDWLDPVLEEQLKEAANAPDEFYKGYHLPTLARIARMLDRPEADSLAYFIWTISTDAPVKQAVEFMDAAGYQAFVGYPLKRK